MIRIFKNLKIQIRSNNLDINFKSQIVHFFLIGLHFDILTKNIMG